MLTEYQQGLRLGNAGLSAFSAMAKAGLRTPLFLSGWSAGKQMIASDRRNGSAADGGGGIAFKRARSPKSNLTGVCDAAI